MDFNIDISLFIGSTQAYGNFTGKIQLPFCPSKDDCISFSNPIGKDVKPIIVKEFFQSLVVTRVIFNPGLNTRVSLMLEDITVNNENDAKSIVAYLEDGFGLYFDEYEINNT